MTRANGHPLGWMAVARSGLLPPGCSPGSTSRRHCTRRCHTVCRRACDTARVQSVTCDNCPTTVRDTPADLKHWIDVGWHDGYMQHACSAVCAKAIVDIMEVDGPE